MTIDIDALAQEIRRVDGNHSLGAGALAEKLAPFIGAMKQDENSSAGNPAPKAQAQGEPTAWLVKIYGNDGMLLDTRLEFVKPVIGSTAKTEFVPLYATAAEDGR